MFDLGSLLLQDARLCPAHCGVELRMIKENDFESEYSAPLETFLQPAAAS